MCRKLGRFYPNARYIDIKNNKLNEMKNWIVNVSGKYGYSFMVETDIEDNTEVICTAKDANLFKDAEDADYAFADDLVSQADIDHFKQCNAYYKI